MREHFHCLLAAFALFGNVTNAVADGLPRIAVMPLKPQRVNADIVKIMDTLVVTHVGATKRYEVIGADEISAMLEMEGMKDKLGCSDVACASEIGGALNARYTIAGSVGKLGDNILINLTLFDNRAMTAVERASITVPNDENLFEGGVRVVVGRLFGVEAPPAVAGSPVANVAPTSPRAATIPMNLTSVPPGASVFINDKLAGTTPLVRDIEKGSHKVVVEKADYGTYTETFQVNPGDSIKKSIQLMSISEARSARSTRITLGTILALGGAAAIGGGALLTKSGVSDLGGDNVGGSIGKMYAGIFLIAMGLTGLPGGIAYAATARDVPPGPTHLDAVDKERPGVGSVRPDAGRRLILGFSGSL
ncbi:MAG: PEGA domain-containing protein [Deltaproteobacteria bacterium]|nr:PEGA domain-containing protein [Deltaproteobacteria bacterium]